MNEDNSNKSIHGLNAQNNIESLLKFCKDKGFISSYKKDFRINRNGYKRKQFYAKFLVVFVGDEKWAIFSTTSMRTDRVKGQQWDSINLKEIEPGITKCYLVYPDSVKESEKLKFEHLQKEYFLKNQYSAIDGIISQDELYNLIEGNALKDYSAGRMKDKQGRVFEDRIAEILSHKENLIKLKADNGLFTGLNFNIYKKIVDCLQVDINEINEIRATSDDAVIGRLPSGGKPKTDVVVDVYFSDGTLQQFTISCKRSSATVVSVHQYTAEAFVEVLDPSNDQLRKLMNEFQRYGNKRDFGTANEDELTNVLSSYDKKLAYWVLGGIGGETKNDIQNADYVLTYDNDSTISIYTVEKYYDKLIKNKVKGHFGTLFYWTYASKQRGKSIQLKMRVL